MCSLISLTRYRTCPSPQEVPCPFLLSIPLPTPRQSLIYFLSLEISFAFSRIYLMERYRKSSFESSFLCAQLSVFQIHLCCYTPVLFRLLQNSLFHWMDKPHWFVHSAAVGHWVLGLGICEPSCCIFRSVFGRDVCLHCSWVKTREWTCSEVCGPFTTDFIRNGQTSSERWHPMHSHLHHMKLRSAPHPGL